jgi:hypothetical protein
MAGGRAGGEEISFSPSARGEEWGEQFLAVPRLDVAVWAWVWAWDGHLSPSRVAPPAAARPSGIKLSSLPFP